MTLKTLMPDLDTLIAYEYQTIRNDTYEKILTEQLNKVQSALNPVFYQVSGMPGSGKSAYCTHFLKNNPDFMYVSFDAIMEKLPAYRQDVIQKGVVKAFKTWEMPARVVGYELLFRLIEQGSNILLEHSGVNQPHLQLCHNIKGKNYQTKVCFLMCDEAVAQQRAKKRESLTQRHTPPELIHQRALLMHEYAEKYYHIADEVHFLDASGDEFVPIKLF